MLFISVQPSDSQPRPTDHPGRASTNDRLPPSTPGNGEVEEAARAGGEHAHWKPSTQPQTPKEPEVVDETR